MSDCPPCHNVDTIFDLGPEHELLVEHIRPPPHSSAEAADFPEVRERAAHGPQPPREWRLESQHQAQAVPAVAEEVRAAADLPVAVAEGDGECGPP